MASQVHATQAASSRIIGPAGRVKQNRVEQQHTTTSEGSIVAEAGGGFVAPVQRREEGNEHSSSRTLSNHSRAVLSQFVVKQPRTTENQASARPQQQAALKKELPASSLDFKTVTTAGKIGFFAGSAPAVTVCNFAAGMPIGEMFEWTVAGGSAGVILFALGAFLVVSSRNKADGKKAAVHSS